ncbi:MAG: GvpL/GvpF family gas vesicle protein [Methanophagales archaeon]|nr:GvpL/GvpF family gas vesicle protein [Methanophagales archaeon]
MPQEGKYVYGILNNGEERSFGEIGIDKEEVYCINFKDISAVVGDSALKTYEVTREKLLAHEQVIREVMKEHTIIPMMFGTVAKDKKDVGDMLDRMYVEFKQVLQRITNKLQIDVKAIWNKDVIYTGILGEDEEIRKLSEKVSKKPADKTYRERVELGKKVMSVLGKRKKEYINEITDALSSYIEDSQQNKLTDDKMIMNTSFLLNKAKEQEIYRKLDELDEQYGEDVQIIAVGPLPPYNFSHIEIKPVDFKTIDAARKTLGLSKEVPMSKIEEAYNRLALQFHPDRNPDASANEKFKKIEQAYSTLRDYCSRYVYSFRRKDVEKTLMVYSGGKR